MLPEPRTLRGYSLRIDLLGFAIVAALLILIIGLTQAELRQKFIDSALSDAAQFDLFIDRQLQLAQDELAAFATRARPSATPAQSVHFSHLYRLDERFEIREIILSEAGNALFPGFIFSPGEMSDFLERSQLEGHASPGWLRGYEQ